ncbi:hypothetical protein F5144DRAFT_552729, partial [Chaetomium tenue]
CHGYGRMQGPDGGVRGERPQPIIKNGSQTNQERNGGNGYRSQGSYKGTRGTATVPHVPQERGTEIPRT